MKRRIDTNKSRKICRDKIHANSDYNRIMESIVVNNEDHKVLKKVFKSGVTHAKFK